MQTLKSMTVVSLVSDKYSRRDVRADLAKRGFYNPWNRLSVFTLQKLTVRNYLHLLGLLEQVRSYIATEINPGFKGPIALILPSADELRRIDFAKIAASEKAFAHIITSVSHGNDLELDLRKLPDFYDRHVK